MQRVKPFVIAAFALLACAGSASANQVGQSRTIKDSNGNSVRISLLKINTNLSGGAYSTPAAGNKFYGLFVRVSNLSGARLDDCAGNDGTLASKAGDNYDVAFTEAKPALTCFKLLPHRVAQGWVVFETPRASHPAYFDWTMDSGFADQTADFKLL